MDSPAVPETGCPEVTDKDGYLQLISAAQIFMELFKSDLMYK